MPSPDKKKIIVLAGPTAIGKTDLSLAMAEEFRCEIISMDSMQIYKYMDIGTAKPSLAERQRIIHHLIDFVDPAEQYNVARFAADAGDAMNRITGGNHLPMLVGGTGLYLKGLLRGIFTLPEVPGEIRENVLDILRTKGSEYLHRALAGIDPESAARIHPHDTQRLTRAMEIWQATGMTWSRHLQQQNDLAAEQRGAFEVIKIGLNCARDVLYARINKRVTTMVEQGLLAEVEKLLARGYTRDLNSMQAIGYKHMVNYIDKVWQWDETLDYLARDTRRYAKRQLTWFGRDRDFVWFKPDEISRIRSFVKNKL
ncbi:MAG: tRNA (adenosine(37)-N6)-dimethylallyltransferase MiaA [Deltaproteobacteria bacterium]|nr:tRNA (adenosine(37)-N6)-dimethylallyltransferase MiaA [Deltaproteobacteria bacterium]